MNLSSVFLSALVLFAANLLVSANLLLGEKYQIGLLWYPLLFFPSIYLLNIGLRFGFHAGLQGGSTFAVLWVINVAVALAGAFLLNIFYLHQPLTWRTLLAAVLVMCAGYLLYTDR